MPKINMRKIIEDVETKTPPSYDMSIGGLKELAEIAITEPCEGVTAAFLYGYVMGYRATRNGQKGANQQ